MEVLEAAAKRTKTFSVINTKNREAYYKGHGDYTVTFILFKKRERSRKKPIYRSTCSRERMRRKPVKRRETEHTKQRERAVYAFLNTPVGLALDWQPCLPIGLLPRFFFFFFVNLDLLVVEQD